MTGKMHTIGSRRQVWNGTSKKTSGGLTKSDLMMNKHGRIVSRSKHNTAKRENRLVKSGYGTKKGTFGFVKISSKKSRKGSKKQRGGHVNNNTTLSPSGIDGQGITSTAGDGSTGVQMLAGMAGGRRRRHRSQSGGSGANGQNMMNPSSLSSEGSMMSPNGSSGYGIAGAGITSGNGGSTNVQMLAGMAGGKRHRMRGGSGANGQNMMSPASVNWSGPGSGGYMLGNGIDGQGITSTAGDGSTGVQMLAGMAGGRRRRHRSQRGGTGNRGGYLGGPQGAALNAEF